jgi:glycosyl transferase family 2
LEANSQAAAGTRADLEGGFAGTQEAIRRLHEDLGRIHVEMEEVIGRARLTEPEARRAAQLARHIYDEEPANRRRLHELRRRDDYELSFTEDEPLVSFIVPTYNSYETLRDVALPSILGQNYKNVEVIVVGDASPPETARAIEEVGDQRVRFHNRTYRGPYPADKDRRWYVVGTPPTNEALALVRGRWITVLGDDDAVRPDHTESLLAAARERRLEQCYGLQQVNFAAGEPLTLGKFPPELGHWGLQSAIYHSGLSFIESELSDTIYEEPNDWSMCRRMLRAGVRIGMIEKVVVDKNESRRASAQQWRDGGIPIVE